jgi:GrpB-like predicted nucleotidyltransferase (UPF0157 family)
MDKLHFLTYEETNKIAVEFFNKEKERIHKDLPHAKIEHVGGTSIPNSLTLGDLDIQIRIKKEKFQEACNLLKNLYHENRKELWTDEFALFHWKDHPVIPMSIILTVIDSAFDEYYKVRDLLKTNPNILEKYNNFKKQFEGKTRQEYKKAKGLFFGENGKNNLL